MRVPKAEDEPEKRAWDNKGRKQGMEVGERGKPGKSGIIFTKYSMVHPSHMNMNYTPTYQYVGYLH